MTDTRTKFAGAAMTALAALALTGCGEDEERTVQSVEAAMAENVTEQEASDLRTVMSQENSVRVACMIRNERGDTVYFSEIGSGSMSGRDVLKVVPDAFEAEMMARHDLGQYPSSPMCMVGATDEYVIKFFDRYIPDLREKGVTIERVEFDFSNL